MACPLFLWTSSFLLLFVLPLKRFVRSQFARVLTRCNYVVWFPACWHHFPSPFVISIGWISAQSQEWWLKFSPPPRVTAPFTTNPHWHIFIGTTFTDDSTHMAGHTGCSPFIQRHRSLLPKASFLLQHPSTPFISIGRLGFGHNRVILFWSSFVTVVNLIRIACHVYHYDFSHASQAGWDILSTLQIPRRLLLPYMQCRLEADWNGSTFYLTPSHKAFNPQHNYKQVSNLASDLYIGHYPVLVDIHTHQNPQRVSSASYIIPDSKTSAQAMDQGIQRYYTNINAVPVYALVLRRRSTTSTI